MFSHNNLSPAILRLPPELRLEIYRFLLLSHPALRMVPSKNPESTRYPNRLFPAILRTCRLVYNEAVDVLYRENVFYAHRLDDTNDNTASITRAIFVIAVLVDEDGEDDVSKLPRFLENHPNLEHLRLAFRDGLLAKSKLRDAIAHILLWSGGGFRLRVHSDHQSTRISYNAQKLIDTVRCMAVMREKNPGAFKILLDDRRKQGWKLMEVS